MNARFLSILYSVSMGVYFSVLRSASQPVYLQDNTWATETLARLSLREKIGQLFVVATTSDFEQPNEALASALWKCPYKMDHDYIKTLIQEYYIGGIIFLFSSTPEKQIALTQQLQELSRIPLLITQDAEWGLSMRLASVADKVVRYPRNMTLGAIVDPQLIYDLGYEIGRQCAAIGVHMNFAPVVDVNNNPENPVIHDRSFGDDPVRVAQWGALFAQGLQDAGILACAKHFPGHGDTAIDSHLDLPLILHDRQRLNSIELLPFAHLIANGIAGIMMAHLAVPALDATGTPASISHSIVTHELKEKHAFNGLVVTDGLGMQALTNHYQAGQIELEAFLAGNDIILCPLDVPNAVTLIEQAIAQGQVAEQELDARVLKILQAKAWAFAQQKRVTQNIDVQTFLTRPDAYALQETLYRRAITVVTGGQLLPMQSDKQCLVQIGEMPENRLITASQGYSYSATCTDAELEDCLKKCESQDMVVVCVGQMHKFAQSKYGVADNTRKLVALLKKNNKRVVVVLCGTPYSVSYFADADTIIVAYEDAPAAQQAVVDVLRGRLQATGRLPISRVGLYNKA